MIKLRLSLLVLSLCCATVKVHAQSSDSGVPESPPPAATPAEAAPAVPAEATTAQTPTAVLPSAAAPPAAQPPVEKLNGEDSPSAAVFDDDQYGSLVFTHWEHIAIQDMKRSRGFVRAPDESELNRVLRNKEDKVEKPKPPPEEREIRLGGIVYHGKKDWTIWLNEERITPTAIPEEVMDLKVYDAYIEMKWYDEWSNQIFPIRLRPHQRFNIDARMFLPG